MKLRNLALALALTLCMLLVAALLLRQEFGPPEQNDPAAGTVVRITELCPKNDSVLPNNAGDYPDYIELHNPGGEVIDLTGARLAAGEEESKPFPEFRLGPGEYRVVLLGERLNFYLAASGGQVLRLLGSDGAVLAEILTQAAGSDQVLLYREEGYVLSDKPSPGFANDEAGQRAFSTGRPDEDPKILISELLTENLSALPDEAGRFSDILELHNPTDSPVNLSGYCLSDSLSNRFRYRLPEVTLNPGSYLVVYCDGLNYVSEAGGIHANFALSYGESLILTDPAGSYLTLEAGYPGDDQSVCLVEGEYVPLPASPGFANDAAGITAAWEQRINPESPLVVSEVLLSSSGVSWQGGFADVVEITNISSETVTTGGWFLSDGGDPYRYALPDGKLQPGECLLLVCEKGSGEQFTGFSLSESESLYLTGPDYRYAPPVGCVAPQPGQSIRLVEGSYCGGPVSLGYENLPEKELLWQQERLPEGLRFSELMSANLSYLKGAYATTSDWIEFYNPTNEPIRLSDYCLSDDAKELSKYPLPDVTVEPGKYRVILLAKSPENLPAGYSILNMTLSSRGEQLYLTRSGLVVDSVQLPSLATDTAYGRPAGCGEFSVLDKVTPGKENGKAAQLSETPQAITAQGVYSGVKSVEVVLEGPGTIYYTTDCTDPNTSSRKYTGPITLTKTTAIRAVCYESGKKASQILDLTYIINEGHTLPVATVITEPDNLWDYYSGIYVKGPGGGDVFPYVGANYWKDWEKPATVSLFETDGTGFSQKCGIKIFGGYSRALDMKSLACYFRDAYGAGELNYPLFGEEGLDTYEAFIFRNTGQDFARARMRDAVLTSLVAEATNVAAQKYRPVVMYINGEYFGVCYIREKINEHYIAGNYNVAPEDVTLTVANGRGCDEYQALKKYIQTHDMSQKKHYEYVCSLMDVEEYIDYILAEMIMGNPDNGNIKFFTTKGGKWNWILYDVDHAYRSVSYNAVVAHLNPAGTGSQDLFSTAVINGLLQNKEFRDAFLTRAAWQLKTIWAPENVLARINEVAGLIGEEMKRDCQRWGLSYTNWQNMVDEMRYVARYRNGYMISHLQSYFGLSDRQMKQYGFDV